MMRKKEFISKKKYMINYNQTEIKVYLCDQNGNIERKIGKTELNIAEYAKKQKFGLQIDVQGQSKKIQQDAIITFQMKMERQDDDSKSVYTSSDEDFQTRSRDIREIETEAKKPSKIKGKLQLISVEESKVSVKSNHSKKRQSKESDADQKYSDKTIKRNKQTSIKKQNLREENSPQSLYDDRVMQKYDYPESRKNTEKPRKRQSSKSKFVINEKSSQNQLTKKINQRKTVEVNQKSVEETSHISNNQSSYQSPQFKLHLAMKKIGDLEKQNSQLTQQSQRLKDIVEKLVSQKSQKQISDTNFSWQANQQIQKCKKSIVQKQLLINQLQNSNKKLMQQEQMKQAIIRGQKSEIKELRLKLQHEKNKLARVLQVLNDSSQKDIIEQVLNQLKDEYY